MPRMRVLILGVLALTACTKIEDAISGGPQTLKSDDGAVSVVVPGSWKRDKLNDQAVIQADNKMSELYVIVISESKEDLSDMTLEKYSSLTRGAQLKVMKDSSEEGPTPKTVNGMPAIEYVLRGSVTGVNVVMKHVSIEGAKHYYQVVSWTLKTKWDTAQPGLEEVVASFKESNSGGPANRAPKPN